MKKEEIHLYDINRILIGNTSPEFLLEVFIRTLIIYFAAIITLRLLGKRMSGELTISELAIMIMMGAIIGPAAQIPDRGLLAGIIIFIFVFSLEKLLNWLEFKKPRAERITQGNISMLVKDGVIDQKEMRKTNIPNEQLFSELRGKKILNLGKVKRVYLEASGNFSIYTTGEEKPGLWIFPPKDRDILDTARYSSQLLACTNCGYVIPRSEKEESCPGCSGHQWEKAMI